MYAYIAQHAPHSIHVSLITIDFSDILEWKFAFTSRQINVLNKKKTEGKSSKIKAHCKRIKKARELHNDTQKAYHSTGEMFG